MAIRLDQRIPTALLGGNAQDALRKAFGREVPTTFTLEELAHAIATGKLSGASATAVRVELIHQGRLQSWKVPSSQSRPWTGPARVAGAAPTRAEASPVVVDLDELLTHPNEKVRRDTLLMVVAERRVGWESYLARSVREEPGLLGEKAVDLLPFAEQVKVLAEHSRPSFRERAATELGKSGNAEAFAPLLRAAREDSAPWVRVEACTGLGALGAADSCSTLAEVLGQEKEEIVLQTAARALGILGGPAARAALSLSLWSARASLRSAVVDALGSAGASQPLLQMMVHDSAGSVSEAARGALSKRAALSDGPAESDPQSTRESLPRPRTPEEWQVVLDNPVARRAFAFQLLEDLAVGPIHAQVLRVVAGTQDLKPWTDELGHRVRFQEWPSPAYYATNADEDLALREAYLGAVEKGLAESVRLLESAQQLAHLSGSHFRGARQLPGSALLTGEGTQAESASSPEPLLEALVSLANEWIQSPRDSAGWMPDMRIPDEARQPWLAFVVAVREGRATEAFQSLFVDNPAAGDVLWGCLCSQLLRLTRHVGNHNLTAELAEKRSGFDPGDAEGLRNACTKVFGPFVGDQEHIADLLFESHYVNLPGRGNPEQPVPRMAEAIAVINWLNLPAPARGRGAVLAEPLGKLRASSVQRFESERRTIDLSYSTAAVTQRRREAQSECTNPVELAQVLESTHRLPGRVLQELAA